MKDAPKSWIRQAPPCRIPLPCIYILPLVFEITPLSPLSCNAQAQAELAGRQQQHEEESSAQRVSIRRACSAGARFPAPGRRIRKAPLPLQTEIQRLSEIANRVSKAEGSVADMETVRKQLEVHLNPWAADG